MLQPAEKYIHRNASPVGSVKKKIKKSERKAVFLHPSHVCHPAFPVFSIPLYSPHSSVGLDVVIGVAIEPASEMPVEQDASIDVRHLRELVSVSPRSARPATGH